MQTITLKCNCEVVYDDESLVSSLIAVRQKRLFSLKIMHLALVRVQTDHGGVLKNGGSSPLDSAVVVAIQRGQ